MGIAVFKANDFDPHKTCGDPNKKEPRAGSDPVSRLLKIDAGLNSPPCVPSGNKNKNIFHK
jgi:hypothetical protein